MSADENDSKPLDEAGNEIPVLEPIKDDDGDTNEGKALTPEEISRQLQEAVQVAEVAVSVAEDMVRQVEERAEDPNADPDEIEEARKSTADSLERAQLAYHKAHEQADKGKPAQGKPEKDRPKTPEEIRQIVSDVIDEQERKQRIKEYQEEEERKEAERKQRLKELEEDSKKRAEERRQATILANQKKKEKEEAEKKAAEREEQRKAAEKAEQERRAELRKTPQGLAQLKKEAKEERIRVAAIKRDALEKVMYQLKPKYQNMRGSLTTMFMLPHLRPLRIEQSSKEHEPKLICDFGMLKKTRNGHRTNKFRAVIRSGPKGLKYEVDHQAWRSFISGKADIGMTEFKWGTDLFGPKPNPKENLTMDEAVAEMRRRLDEVEQEHESMVTGRLVKAGALVAALVGGIAYHEHAKAEDLESSWANDGENSAIVVGDKAARMLPAHVLYDPDANELLLEEQGDEPSF